MRTEIRAVFLIAGVSLALGCSATPRPVTLCARLAGAGPSSDATDPQHRGFGILRLEATAIRYDIQAPGLEHVIAVHIHHGSATENGPMLWEISPGYFGDASRGRVTEVPPGVVALVAKFPDEFYLKLHSVAYPGGAIRGQLGPCGR